VRYTVQQKIKDTLLVKVEGTNKYTPPKIKSNDISLNSYKLQSVFEGVQKVDMKSGVIYFTSVTAVSKSRKLVMSQQIDNQIKEETVITNTFGAK
jgi:hypothetical protein